MSDLHADDPTPDEGAHVLGIGGLLSTRGLTGMDEEQREWEGDPDEEDDDG